LEFFLKRSDELRDELEEEILTGLLRPGKRLEEAHLAERFGVSRTPENGSAKVGHGSGVIISLRAT
jgi:hypothetical protein